MKHKIWFWLSFVLAVVLAIYFGVRIILHTMGRGPATLIPKVSITADVRDADLSPIAAGIGVYRGARSADLDLDATVARLTAIPGVRDAAVRRMPNGALKVKVSLYKAVALWTDGDAFYPLSADGTIVKSPHAERDAGAIVFRGTLPDDITDIIAAAQALSADIDFIEWIEERRWDIHTTRGVRILLPEQDAPAAIATLATLNQNHNILARELQWIDMRDMARILVR